MCAENAGKERTEEMDITKETTVGALLGRYPWLKDELVKANEKFKLLDNPLIRGMIQKATLAFVGEKAGLDADSLVRKVVELVASHKE